MKIFSWVHRQFLHKVAKKDDNDKVALLEHEAFAAACGWNEGLLTIGTLGADLFQDFKPKEDTFMNDDHQVLFFNNGDDGGDHDDEMEHPLVQNDVVENNFSPCDEVAKPNNLDQEYVVVKDSMKIRRCGERTTLADLLRADSEQNLFKNYDELSNDHKIEAHFDDDDDDDDDDSNKNNTDTESIKSYFIPKAKKKFAKNDSARPIKKAKQLMRKIFRKKIHPDVGMIICQEMDVHAT